MEFYAEHAIKDGAAYQELKNRNKSDQSQELKLGKMFVVSSTRGKPDRPSRSRRTTASISPAESVLEVYTARLLVWSPHFDACHSLNIYVPTGRTVIATTAGSNPAPCLDMMPAIHS